MKSLYELLGVKMTATTDAIHKAYRKRAKKAHPDTGGNAEEFALLKKAHDILVSPERRAKYDATGDTTDSTPDNSLSQVIGLLAMSLDQVLTAIESRMGDPTEFAIVNDMKILVGGKLDELQKKRQQFQTQRKKTEKLVGRFGVKSGENYLEGIITGKLSALDTNIRQLDDQEKPIKKALDILTNSSFRSDSGGSDSSHTYGAKSAFKLEDLMRKATYGAFG